MGDTQYRVGTGSGLYTETKEPDPITVPAGETLREQRHGSYVLTVRWPGRGVRSSGVFFLSVHREQQSVYPFDGSEFLQ